jgi:hypothetical protein
MVLGISDLDFGQLDLSFYYGTFLDRDFDPNLAADIRASGQ